MNITAPTPCHNRPVRLTVVESVPRERYERTCAACGFEWTIERRVASVTAQARVDVLDWTAASRVGVTRLVPRPRDPAFTPAADRALAARKARERRAWAKLKARGAR
jgi:hypothetical protein